MTGVRQSRHRTRLFFLTSLQVFFGSRESLINRKQVPAEREGRGYSESLLLSYSPTLTSRNSPSPVSRASSPGRDKMSTTPTPPILLSSTTRTDSSFPLQQSHQQDLEKSTSLSHQDDEKLSHSDASEGGRVGEKGLSNAVQAEDLQRGLNSRQISMIAIVSSTHLPERRVREEKRADRR